jgi:hypothetical protein
MAYTYEVSSLGVQTLLRQHAALLNELIRRGVVRSYNNPVGDYAEYLFSGAFGWTLAANSEKGFDARDSAYRYQIKARRITSRNGSRQLSALRSLEAKSFDFVAGVLFAEDYSVYRAALVPYHRVASTDLRFSKHVNGHLFFLTDDVWDWPDVQDVTDDLRRFAGDF